MLGTAAFNNGQWEKVISVLSEHLKTNIADSSAWFQYAVANMKLSKYQEAQNAFDLALKTNFYPYQVYYSQAVLYALKLETSKMYDALDQAVAAGFGAIKRIETEEAFTSVNTEARYMEIIQKVNENAYPCLTDENHRAFDFWLGEWEVMVGGRKVGDNSITRANGGCAIHENYVTGRTYTGQSINYYSKMDSKWHQTWVDSQGGVLDYIEIDRSKGMIQFLCDYLGLNGLIIKSRLTFTKNDDGSVRQLFEDSEDGVKWTPTFDGQYVLKTQ